MDMPLLGSPPIHNDFRYILAETHFPAQHACIMHAFTSTVHHRMRSRHSGKNDAWRHSDTPCHLPRFSDVNTTADV